MTTVELESSQNPYQNIMNQSTKLIRTIPAISQSGESKKNLRQKVITYIMMSKREFTNLDMSSSHERDISWYGLFDPSANKMVAIKAATKCTVPKNTRMSTYKTALDHIMKSHILSLKKKGLLQPDLYILCIGYSAGDAQIGVTGTVEEQYIHMAALRELREESGISHLGWFQQVGCRTSRRCKWTGFIGGLGAKCMCSEEARQCGWECCASGYGRCAPFVSNS